MYERYYGFNEKPFSLLPDPTFLYLGRQHTAAYTLLEYAVLSQAGFTILTGEVGCGKTALIRHLLNQFNDGVTVGLLTNTHRRLDDLLQWILMAFGLEYESKEAVRSYEIFVEFLVDEYARNRRVVLIVDEAQNLDAATLEELRTLSNVNADKNQVLQLILVGQPELRTTLERSDLRQFAQRVVAHYHLMPLGEEDTISYIRHRLARAGGSPDLFTPEACQRVYRYSGGVPRLINLICDTALVHGYADDETEIGLFLIQSVLDERAAGMNLELRDDVPADPQKSFPPAADHSPDPPKAMTEQKGERIARFDNSDARQLFSHLLKEDSKGKE